MNDPEVVINEALREMKEKQSRNRELAVQAMTQTNTLKCVLRGELAGCWIVASRVSSGRGRTFSE